MPMTRILKPCPFCGKKLMNVVHGNAEKGFHIQCPRCGARGPIAAFHNELPEPEASAMLHAACAWNHREGIEEDSDE